NSRAHRPLVPGLDRASRRQAGRAAPRRRLLSRRAAGARVASCRISIQAVLGPDRSGRFRRGDPDPSDRRSVPTASSRKLVLMGLRGEYGPFVAWVSAIAGLLVGSFLNVLAHRLPRGESTVSPGSHCPFCGAPIAPRDNIPLISWILLGGRCRA